MVNRIERSAEDLVQLTENVCERLADHIRDEIPERGIFTPAAFRFHICGTKNLAVVRVSHHAANERSISLHVVRAGYDRAYTHFLMRGTNEELSNALRSQRGKREFLKDVRSLSQSVDEYHD